MTDKTTLSAPQLPATIAGDGRYVMSLLNDFCSDVADSLGRVEDKIADQAPIGIDNFLVTFDREGILWQWDSVPGAISYELTVSGARLALTSETTSRAVPPSAVGNAVLTAHLADGTKLTETLSYTKARPRAPQSVTRTLTEGGLRIDYSAIPADCIGIELIADTQTHRTTESSYLYTGGAVTRLVCAYYDNFGCGETTTIVGDVPAVERFFAEQNGEWIDLSWNSIDRHSVTYTIKTAYRVPDWNSATTLITTSLTHARLRFPQEGEVFFLIKATDETGATSPVATYATLDRAADQAHNVIITLDQSESFYANVKTNLYYDAIAEGLRLTDGARRGEYLIPVHLPQTYRARNWLACKLIGVTDSALAWDDSTFAWTSEDGASTVWNGASGDISESVLTKEIAEEAAPSATETVWTMAGTLLSTDDVAPIASSHADTFALARWDQGLCLSPLTRLSYPIDETDTFSLIFHLTADSYAQDSEIVTLLGADGALSLRYMQGKFRLVSGDGHTLTLDYLPTSGDHLTLGISQSPTIRTLRLASLAQNTDRIAEIAAPPCTAVTTISYHLTDRT